MILEELCKPIEVVKYSEETNNRDTFLLQKAEPQHIKEENEHDSEDGGKIVMHNKALLFGDETIREMKNRIAIKEVDSSE